MTDKPPKAPLHLHRATRRWFADVVSTWRLDPHHVRLLTLACVAWDQHHDARSLIAAEGLTVRTASGISRAHPAVAIARDAHIAFVRTLRELDLDVSTPAEGRRPPALKSITGAR